MEKWKSEDPYRSPITLGNRSVFVLCHGPSLLSFSDYSDKELFTLFLDTFSYHTVSSYSKEEHLGSVGHAVSFSSSLFEPVSSEICDANITDTLMQGENVFIRNISSIEHFDIRIKPLDGAHVYFYPLYKFTSFTRSAVLIERGSLRALITTLGDASVCEDLTVNVKDGSSQLIITFGSITECIKSAERAVREYSFGNLPITKTDLFFREILSDVRNSLKDPALSLLSLRKEDGSFISSGCDRLSRTEDAPYIMRALLSLGLDGIAKSLALFYVNAFEKDKTVLPIYGLADRSPSHSEAASLLSSAKCILYCLDKTKDPSLARKSDKLIKAAIKKGLSALEHSSLCFSGCERSFSDKTLSFSHLFDLSLSAHLDLFESLSLYKRVYTDRYFDKADTEDLKALIIALFTSDKGVFPSAKSRSVARRPRVIFAACPVCLEHGNENYRELELMHSSYICPLCHSRNPKGIEYPDIGIFSPSVSSLALLSDSELFDKSMINSLRSSLTSKTTDENSRYLLEHAAKQHGIAISKAATSSRVLTPSSNALSLSLYIIANGDK